MKEGNEMNNERVKLGDEAKCKITGFKGIVTAHSKCLTGCDRVTIRASMQKDGKMGEEYWFDIDAVEVVKREKVKISSVQSKETGKQGGPISRSNLK